MTKIYKPKNHRTCCIVIIYRLLPTSNLRTSLGNKIGGYLSNL
ncbi:17041_t:CDS:1, partial [Dentiscutata heterogama]